MYLCFQRTKNTKLFNVQNKENKLIIISGPTAVGKTSLSIQLAKELQTEIISCDSKQFYREMTIGTAKPNESELKEVRHHFIDSLSIHQEYSVGDFEKDCIELLDTLFTKNKVVIMTGGSGLFVNAIMYGLDDFPNVNKDILDQLEKEWEELGTEKLYKKLKVLDPEYAEKVDIKNHRRIIRALGVCLETQKPYSQYLNKTKIQRNFQSHLFVLNDDREALYKRINQRVDQMVDRGLVEEAKSLYPYKNLRSMRTVGYQELFNYFDGEWTLEFAIEKIKQHTRNYAKRQLTWYRKNEDATWIQATEENAISIIKNKIQ